MDNNEKLVIEPAPAATKQLADLQKRLRRKAVIETCIWVVVGILLAVFLILTRCRCDHTTEPGNNRPSWSTDIDPNSGDMVDPDKQAIIDELNRQVEEGMMTISMNSNPIFADGDSEGNLLIVNDERNRHPQIVEIYIEDTGEMIYQSGAIPVGKGIDAAKLDVHLDAGVYSCVAYFNQIDDEGSLLGKAGARITVTILE